MIVGRSDELARLHAVALAALDGRGATMVVTGALGIGASTLLARVAEQVRSSGVGVVFVTARRTERELHRPLLRDLLVGLRDLAGVDATALAELSATVDSVSDAELPARLVAALGTDGAVCSSPTLIVVDDLDHADLASAGALAYLAHRVQRSSLSIILSCRDAVDAGVGDLPTMELGGLTLDEVAALLDSSDHDASTSDVGSRDAERSERSRAAHGFDRGVIEALHRMSAGSPLIVTEIAANLSAAQRAGHEPLPLFPALSREVVLAVQGPVSALSPPSRRALTLAACEPSGDIRVISRAAAMLDVGLDALAEAEECGLVHIDAGRVRFDQPLRRLVAYHAVAAPSRRTAHRALAAALDGPTEAEQRALHLALGTVEPDERIASDIELAAQAAERRGDHGAARQWWLHAARLSPVRADATTRERRAHAVGDSPTGPLAALTDGERRVAEVVGTGVSNKAAALALHVSVKTVDTHLQSIYRKLGLRSRSELAVLVARHAPDPMAVVSSGATPSRDDRLDAGSEVGR
jgi:DNA-binding NarL/FixJ family response regulator